MVEDDTALADLDSRGRVKVVFHTLDGHVLAVLLTEVLDLLLLVIPADEDRLLPHSTVRLRLMQPLVQALEPLVDLLCLPINIGLL